MHAAPNAVSMETFVHFFSLDGFIVMLYNIIGYEKCPHAWLQYGVCHMESIVVHVLMYEDLVHIINIYFESTANTSVHCTDMV